MTDSIMAFIDCLRKKGVEENIDFLRKASEFIYQQLINLEAEEVIGAGRYERTPERQTHRNGTREHQMETRVGEIPLKTPKLRRGSYFSSFLEPRKQSEEALLAVVQGNPKPFP